LDQFCCWPRIRCRKRLLRQDQNAWCTRRTERQNVSSPSCGTGMWSARSGDSVPEVPPAAARTCEANHRGIEGEHWAQCACVWRCNEEHTLSTFQSWSHQMEIKSGWHSLSHLKWHFRKPSHRSKLKALFALKRGKSDFRVFASSFAKSFQKYHFKWDRLYTRNHNPRFPWVHKNDTFIVFYLFVLYSVQNHNYPNTKANTRPDAADESTFWVMSMWCLTRDTQKPNAGMCALARACLWCMSFMQPCQVTRWRNVVCEMYRSDS